MKQQRWKHHSCRDCSARRESCAAVREKRGHEADTQQDFGEEQRSDKSLVEDNAENVFEHLAVCLVVDTCGFDGDGLILDGSCFGSED